MKSTVVSAVSLVHVKNERFLQKKTFCLLYIYYKDMHQSFFKTAAWFPLCSSAPYFLDPLAGRLLPIPWIQGMGKEINFIG
jgi:hypothetical protein